MKKICKVILAAAAIVALAVPAMAAGTPKLLVKDSTGANTTFVVNDDGTVGAGVSSTIYPFEMTSANASLVPAGVGAFMMNGSNNKERFEVRSAGVVYGQGPTFQGKGSGGTIGVPSATLFDHVLFALGGSGYDGTQWVIGNKALVKIKATETWSTTAQGTMISFEVTPNGSLARTEYLAINTGGIKTVKVSNAPLQISTSGTAPTCSLSFRGSFWVNQGASTDTVQVCLQTSTGVYGWKTVSLL